MGHSARDYVQIYYPGKILLPIILFSDATQVTKFGSVSVCPLVMTIGLYKLEYRQKREFKVLLGYFPMVSLSTISSTSAAKLHREIHHRCWKVIMSKFEESVIALENILLPNGLGEFSFYPAIAFLCGDHPEQMKHSLVINRTGCCRVCLVDKSTILDLDFKPNLRLENKMNASIPSTVGLHAGLSAFNGVFIGSKQGIYGHTPACIMVSFVLICFNSIAHVFLKWIGFSLDKFHSKATSTWRLSYFIE